MDNQGFKDSIIEMSVVNTKSLTFAKNGSTQNGLFTVNIFLKDYEGDNHYGLLFFTVNPIPKVVFFRNVVFDNLGNKYDDEVELYKHHISQTTGTDYTGNNFDSKIQVNIDVEGFTTKQVVDDDGNPVFNEDGTPKMVNKSFTAKGNMN